MAPPSTDSPPFDVTVRVGCSLAYEVTGSAMLLLNLRPAADRNHAIVFEAFTAGDNLPVEEFADSHGNRVTRVKLAPGRNLFRRHPSARMTLLVPRAFDDFSRRVHVHCGDLARRPLLLTRSSQHMREKIVNIGDLAGLDFLYRPGSRF